MSIPLDRLYHFLDNLCDDNVVIYRWFPHGSKKIEDLKLHRMYSFDPRGLEFLQEHYKTHVTPTMICHDQEPLQYNYYSKIDLLNFLGEHLQHKSSILKIDEFIQELSNLHLRAKTTPHNIYDYTLLCHSEKNSEQLKIYENNYFIGVYYWAHALIARDWFRFAEHDLSLITNFNRIRHDFLIYNRAWLGTREYRLKFSEMIVESSLEQSCNIKFNPYDTNIHYTDYVFQNKSFELKNKSLESTLTENTSQSWDSADYNQVDYQQSAIEVVLETLFDDTRHHLTEKILRPIACGRPFILASTPGSLAYLRDYGFKTFDGLINEQYDCISDSVERLEFIVSEMKRISSLNAEEKINLWTKLYEVAEYNKQHLFSDKFHNFVVEEFVNNLNLGLEKCRQYTGARWTRFKSYKHNQNKSQLLQDLIILVDQWLKDYIESR